MGNAYTALADGFEASYYNPAGVVGGSDVRVGFGYVQAFSDLSLNGQALELRETKLGAVVAGMSASGEMGGRGAGFSFGFLLPNEGAIRASSLEPLQPNWVLLTNRTQRAEILFTGGLEIVPGLDVGAGFSLGAELGGEVAIEASTFPAAAGGSGTIEIGAQFFPMLGLRWVPAEHVRLGLTYRGETQFPLRIPAEINLLLVPGSELGANLLLLVEQPFYYTPQQVATGVAWDPSSEWTLSADLVWWNWSAAGDPGVRGALEVSGALAGLLPLPTIQAPMDPNFHDIVTPRFGVEWRPPGTPFGVAALRAGYGYEPTPTPRPIGVQNLLDSDKHIVSGGVGFRFRDPWGILRKDADFDVHGQYFRFEQRKAEKLDPTDPVGDLVFGGDRWLVGALLTIHF
jgi:long-chain fatty acid transport protein